MPQLVRNVEPFARRLRRLRWQLLLSVLLGLGAAAWIGVHEPGSSWLSRLSYDFPFYLRLNRQLPDTVLVEITTNTLQKLGADQNGRLLRTNHVRLLQQLGQVGPRLVLIDIAFLTPNPADAALAQEFRRLSNVVVIGSDWTNERPWADASGGVHHAPTPVETFVAAGLRWGHIKLGAPSRTVVRRLLVVSDESTNDTTIAWEAAQVVNPTGPAEVMNDRDLWVNYYARAEGAFTRVAYELVWRGEPQVLAQLTNKLVFVGYRLESSDDWFKHPAGGQLPGLVVQATQVQNLVRGEWLRQMPGAWQMVLFLLTAAGASFTLNFLSISRARVLLAGSAVAVLICSILLQWWGRTWWHWTVPVLVQIPVLLATTAFHRLGVFISYRSSDGEASARAVQQALFNAGKSVYLAPGNITAGDSYPNELLRAVQGARVFLLVLSPDALKSLAIPGSWVAREASHAIKTRRRIVILRVGVPPLTRESVPAEFTELVEKHSVEFQSGQYFGPMVGQLVEGLKG